MTSKYRKERPSSSFPVTIPSLVSPLSQDVWLRLPDVRHVGHGRLSTRLVTKLQWHFVHVQNAGHSSWWRPKFIVMQNIKNKKDYYNHYASWVYQAGNNLHSRQQLARQVWSAMINIDIVSFPWTHFLHLLVKGQHWECSCVHLQRLDLLWFFHWTGRWFSCGLVELSPL